MMPYSPLDEVARRRQLFREQNPVSNRPILHLNPTSAFSTVSSTTEGPSPRSPLTPLTSASEARSYTPRGTPPAFVRRRTLIQVPRSPTEYPDNIDHVQILRTDKDSNVGTDINRRSGSMSTKERGSRGPAERELLAGMTDQLLWTNRTDQNQNHIREPLRSAPPMMDRRFPLSVSPQSYQLASPNLDTAHAKISPFQSGTDYAQDLYNVINQESPVRPRAHARVSARYHHERSSSSPRFPLPRGTQRSPALRTGMSASPSAPLLINQHRSYTPGGSPRTRRETVPFSYIPPNAYSPSRPVDVTRSRIPTRSQSQAQSQADSPPHTRKVEGFHLTADLKLGGSNPPQPRVGTLAHVPFTGDAERIMQGVKEMIDEMRDETRGLILGVHADVVRAGYGWKVRPFLSFLPFVGSCCGHY